MARDARRSSAAEIDAWPLLILLICFSGFDAYRKVLLDVMNWAFDAHPVKCAGMGAYTGCALSWDWVMNASKVDLTPPHMELRELPPLEIPIPGRTPLV